MSHRSNRCRLVLAGLVILVAALPAHADAPVGRYNASMGSGTVFDTKTQLTWQQTAPTSAGDDGQGNYTWAHAKTYCAGLTIMGAGWRLPTVKELLTIVDFSKANPPQIDTTVNGFPGATADVFWSVTPLAGSPSDAWYVYFGDGSTSGDDVAGTLRVRCVR